MTVQILQIADYYPQKERCLVPRQTVTQRSIGLEGILHGHFFCARDGSEDQTIEPGIRCKCSGIGFSSMNIIPIRERMIALASFILLSLTVGLAQNSGSKNPESTANSQLKVNWLYGSYVPKEVPLTPLNGKMRWKLYVRSTYATWGIYVKTTFFTIHDQAKNTYPEWGDGFEGFAKRYGTRQVEFVLQNSTIALGDGLLGWEPRYDRCHCTGIWPRTMHAFIRNFVTYDRTEKSLRPQLMPYVGAFVGSTTTTTWQPGNEQWQIKGYQAVITQVPVGMGINWISEFAPELFGWVRKRKG